MFTKNLLRIHKFVCQKVYTLVYSSWSRWGAPGAHVLDPPMDHIRRRKRTDYWVILASSQNLQVISGIQLRRQRQSVL